jgi:UDP-N-acetylmuramyl pentapeptide phosphotransferase/UDP-N-acetylglucosamine-1-phosphate transferase
MLIAALVTFGATAVLTPALAAWARSRSYLDIPNARSSHVVATPRIGGVALVVGVLAGVFVLLATRGGPGSHTLVVLGGSVGIAALGLLDDFRQLPALVRLVVQLLVAGLVVITVGPLRLPLLDAGAVATLLSVVWIVAVTNAYNFMDGIDGIAGGQAVVAGVAWAIVARALGVADVGAVALLLAAGSCGFLLHNWHPARVFMGDAGSGFLGFSFAALPLLAPDASPAAIWPAALVLWAFLFDTGATLVRRAVRGEHLLTAHKSHIYQRLVQTGRSHAFVAMLYVGLAITGGLAAAWITRSPNGWAAIVCIPLSVIAAGLWLVVARREAAVRRTPEHLRTAGKAR